MSGHRRAKGKPMTKTAQPIRSESFFAARRAEAKTSKDRAAVEWNALRARMRNASDQEWERVARLLAGLHR